MIMTSFQLQSKRRRRKKARSQVTCPAVLSLPTTFFSEERETGNDSLSQKQMKALSKKRHYKLGCQ